jgi:hypothetical protein
MFALGWRRMVCLTFVGKLKVNSKGQGSEGQDKDTPTAAWWLIGNN